KKRTPLAQIVVDDGRYVVELGDRGLLGDRDQRSVDLLHDVLQLRPGVVLALLLHLDRLERLRGVLRERVEGDERNGSQRQREWRPLLRQHLVAPNERHARGARRRGPFYDSRGRNGPVSRGLAR